MIISNIIATQKRIGVVPDGFWGPKSTEGAKKHLLAMMPKPHPFPDGTARAVEAFYGKHGVKGGYTPPTKKITLPFPIYYEGSKVTALSPHVKCADAFAHAYDLLFEMFPKEADRRAAGIVIYDGLYNPRKMRGGSAWSMHSWAIAVDHNAAKNGNKWHWPTKAVMPIEVMECFARAGITPAGVFWNRDAMHMQATKP